MATARASKVLELAPRVLELLPGTQSDIAKALGRGKSDGTVRRTLDHLATQGFAEKANGRWQRCQTESTQPTGETAAPADFDQESRALFERVLQYVRGLTDELWNDAMIATAERYVRSKQLAREARATIDGKPYVKSSNGRVFKHPAVEDARQHERDAHMYAEALLLTPATRKRAGAKSSGGGPDPFDLD